MSLHYKVVSDDGAAVALKVDAPSAAMSKDVEGGYIGAFLKIPAEQVETYPQVIKEGSTLVVKAQDGRCVWAGELLEPAIGSNGKATLGAEGWGKKLAQDFDRLLYQVNPGDWSAADEEPFNYRNDAKHTTSQGSDFGDSAGSSTVIETDNRRLDSVGTIVTEPLTGLEAGQAYQVSYYLKATNTTAKPVVKCFIRNTTDAEDSKATRRRIDYDATDLAVAFAFVPESGKSYAIRVEFESGTPASTKPVLVRVNYGKTAEISAEQIEASLRGRNLVFKAKKDVRYFGGETSAMALPAPDQPLSSVVFTPRFDHRTDNYLAVLYGTTYPDGDLTVIQSWNLTTDLSDGEEVTAQVDGDYDQLLFAFKRKEGAGKKHAKRYRFVAQDVRVNARATDDEDTTSDVIRDICALTGISEQHVQDSALPAMPADFDSGTYLDVTTEMALMDDYRAIVRGEKPMMDYGPYETRIYDVVMGTVDPIPLQRFNVAQMKVKAPGDTEKTIEVLADPNPLPPGIRRVFKVDIEPPSEDRGQALAESVLPYLGRKRTAGSARLYVVSRDGVEYPGDILEAGDCIRYRGTVSRIESLQVKDIPDRAKSGYVDVTLAAGHPVLTRFLQRKGPKKLSAGQGAQMSVGESIPVPDQPPDLPTATASPLPRGVKIKIVPPPRYADGSDAEFDIEDLRYNITLKQGGDTFDTIEYGKGTNFQFLMSKVEAAVGDYYAEVEALGPDGTSNGIYTTNLTDPDSIISEGVDDGTIDYAKFVASLGGLHWMNVSPSTDGSGVHYVPGGAAGAPSDKKEGDACYNAWDEKMYRYDGTNWLTAVDGADILANSIVANKLAVTELSAITANLGNVTVGTLTGVTITGAVFRSAVSGERVEINPLSTGTSLTWWSSIGTINANITVDNGSEDMNINAAGLLRIGTDTTLEGALDHNGSAVGFYGVTPVSRPTVDNTAVGADLAAVRAKLNTTLETLRLLGLFGGS